MGTALFFNPDFEAEIASRGRYARPAWAAGLGRRLAPAIAPLGGPEDVILLDGPADLGGLDLAGLPHAVPLVARSGKITRLSRLVAWGATPSAAARARALGLAFEAPPFEVVRRVNSKLWSHEVERALGTALPGAAIVRSVEEAARAVRAAAAPRWVLKSLFGVAGRGRYLGRGPALGRDAAAWLARRAGRDGAVVFEPWVEVEREFGVEIEVAESGEVRLLGVAESVLDASGHYAGSRIGPAVAPEPGLAERLAAVAREVGRRLLAEGYFGPAGIDAFVFRTAGGGLALRPIVEVNARHAMGMIALRFAPLVSPGGAGVWRILAGPLAGKGSVAEAIARAGLPGYDPATREGALPAGGAAAFVAARDRAALALAERALAAGERDDG